MLAPISDKEFESILRDMEDPTLRSEMEAICHAQKLAEIDYHTEGNTNQNPFCPFTEQLEFQAYRQMARYLHDPNLFNQH